MAVTGGDPAAVLGVLSLIFWSLLLVVTLKYIVLILRADNAGEGGMLSLLALVQQKFGTIGHVGNAAASRSRRSARRCSTATRSSRPRSRCSRAVEGLELLDPDVRAGWFCRSRSASSSRCSRSSAAALRASAACSDPIMVLWFGTLAVLGAREIVAAPEVLDRGFAQLRLDTARDPPGRRADDLGRRIPRADGRRGAVRRHGALRQATRAARVARAGLAGAAVELLRSRRAAADGAMRPSRIRSSRSHPRRCCRRSSCSRPRPASSLRRPRFRERSP